jgi:hypothetical protein
MDAEHAGGGARFRAVPRVRLATKLQELALTQEGLVTNIVSFNVGVEMGQMLALTFVLIGLTWWRTRPASSATPS